jgi:hypothetical protein
MMMKLKMMDVVHPPEHLDEQYCSDADTYMIPFPNYHYPHLSLYPTPGYPIYQITPPSILPHLPFYPTLPLYSTYLFMIPNQPKDILNFIGE